MEEITVRILDKTFEEVEHFLVEANLTDYVVHGTQDGSKVYVSGEDDVLSKVRALGMIAEAWQGDSERREISKEPSVDDL